MGELLFQTSQAITHPQTASVSGLKVESPISYFVNTPPPPQK